MSRTKPRTMIFTGYDASGQYRHAIECMQQDGALGEILMINLNQGALTAHPTHPEKADMRLPENTIAVLLDGGDRDTGELWKTWYLPHAHQACVLVEENGQNFPWGSNVKPPKGAAKIHTGDAARQALAEVISVAREGSVLCLRRDMERRKLEPETTALNLEEINEAIEVVIATGYREGDGQIIFLWHPKKEIGFEVVVPEDAEVYDATDQDKLFDQSVPDEN